MEEDVQEESVEELTMDERVEHLEELFDALVEILVKKGVLTEEELDKEYDDMFEEEGSEEAV